MVHNVPASAVRKHTAMHWVLAVTELVRQQAQVVVATGVVTHLAKARNNGAPKRAATPLVVVVQVGLPTTSVSSRTLKAQSRVTEN